MCAAQTSSATTYRHLFDLSKGGMGQVALAVRRDGRFVRLYAVKRLLPALREDREAREMFLEEGRLAGLLHHPNVVGVTDVGEDAEGPYLVMDYIEGLSARELIVRASADGFLLSLSMVCSIVAQVARGLAAAHELRSHSGASLHLIHRDVSPHNILIGFDGTARIADFGIARATGREHRTSTGVLKGKLGYMAPEMLQFHEPTAQSDLFSLGIVLFELLTLQRLYGGENDRERARKILQAPPPDVGDLRPDVPPPLQALLLQMLAKDPVSRPKSAALVAEALEACVVATSEEEGPPAIDEFMNEVFSDERDIRKEEVQRQLVALDSAEVETTPSRRGSWLGLALLSSVAAVAVVVAMVAGGAYRWSQGDQGVDQTEEASDGPLPDDGAVQLRLSSTPSRAIVIADDPQLPPLRTPGVLDVRRGASPITLRVELEGYESVRRTFVPTENGALHVQLTAAPIEMDAMEGTEVNGGMSDALPVPPPTMESTMRRRRRPTVMQEDGFEFFDD